MSLERLLLLASFQLLSHRRGEKSGTSKRRAVDNSIYSLRAFGAKLTDTEPRLAILSRSL